MKLINVFVVSALALVMVACGGSAKDNLVGKWQVTGVDMSSMMESIPEEQKAFMEAMVPMMEEAMKSMTMEFAADGKVTQKSSMMGQEKEEEGSWKLSDDSKKLTITTNGNEESMDITELSASKMVVKISEEEGEISLTMEKK
ncbi:hypothetical protein GCM10009118_33820 [Wandonia haliotis]|uniref:Lipocalin-like domain-containing protein n=1 Tax=Wandonia haliotis TaxID=574963 RepID=A0ABN1MUD2_9FLAO